jgi:hypothetical protein
MRDLLNLLDNLITEAPLAQKTFYEKARLAWDSLPDDFVIFSRYSEDYKKMIHNAEIMAQRYKEIGCEDLCENIQKSIGEKLNEG